MSSMSDSNTIAQLLRKWGAGIIILAAVFLAVFNSLKNPAFESPDELQHYQFVRYLIDNRHLPVQSPTSLELTQFHQPPLYYLIGAVLAAPIEDNETILPRNLHWTSYKPYIFHRDNKSQFLPAAEFSFPYSGTALVVHVLRLWSIILLFGTLLVTLKMGKLLWPDSETKPLLMLAFVAFNPMFLYIASSINNDNLIIFLGSVFLFLTMAALDRKYSWPVTILLGFVWGMAVLAKISGVFLGLPLIVSLGWLSWRERDWGLFVSRAAVLGLLVLVLAGWWFGRNFALYQELTGVERMLDIWGERQSTTFDWIDLNTTVSNSWSSFWGVFGYGQIVFPTIIYWIYTLVTMLGLVGLVGGIGKFRLEGRRTGRYLIMGTALGIFFIGLLYYNFRSPTGANGRYTYPALTAFGAVMAMGFSNLRLPRQVMVGLASLLALLAVFGVGWLIPWTYAEPAVLSQEAYLEKVSTSHDVYWTEGMRLLGTAVTPRTVTTSGDDELWLTACFQADKAIEKNYTFFVHVLDPAFNPAGQRNMHPGLGNNPTSLWEPGEIFCDEFAVPLMDTGLTGPALGRVELGFFEDESQAPLTAYSEGNRPLELFIADRIKLVPSNPAPVEAPENVVDDIQFQQGLALAGYGLSSEVVAPGDSFVLTVWWEAAGPLDGDYNLFAHLVDEAGEIVAQADGPPLGGSYPTYLWGAETIVDRRPFSVPEDIAPGSLSIRIGFYRLDNGARLARSGEADVVDYGRLPAPIIQIQN